MKKVIHIDKFDHVFPKDIFMEDISKILFVYMIIMIALGVLGIFVVGLTEGLLLLIFALCLFLAWLKTQYYLKHNYLEIKEGLILIDKNRTIRSYKVESLVKLEYVKYDKLIFSRLPQFVFYMDDGVKYAIDYNDKDENSAIAMQYVLEEYKANQKKLEVIDLKRNYFREILILVIAIVIVLTVKFFFS